MNKPKLLFVYDHKYPDKWRDGLWAALKLLEQDFDITWLNLQESKDAGKKHSWYSNEFVFVLGWGAFNSPVEYFLRSSEIKKKGLCLAGYAVPSPDVVFDYDVLFYETEWSKKWLETTGIIGQFPQKTKFIHAFGINSKIYNLGKHLNYGAYFDEILWDYLSVGSFSNWKRQRLILNKRGDRMVIGEIQKENYAESFDIIMDLLIGGVAVSDMVDPETLASFYRVTSTVYIPAELIGGGERAVLEARACGVLEVEVEEDNPKLQELLTSPIWNEKYYAEQLKKGMMECL